MEQPAPAVEATPEVKPEETPKPAEGAVPEGPQYTDFAMPEGFEAQPATLSAYKNILGKYALPQEAGQEMLEFGAQTVKDAIKAEGQRQQDVFADTQRKWSKQIDQEFGNRRNTVLSDANWVLGQFGGNKQQIKELNEVLAYTGAGNNPSLVRLLHNVSKKLREREAPLAHRPTNPKDSVPAYTRRYAGANGSQRA